MMPLLMIRSNGFDAIDGVMTAATPSNDPTTHPVRPRHMPGTYVRAVIRPSLVLYYYYVTATIATHHPLTY